MVRKARARSAVAVVTLALVVGLMPSGKADAAGVTTHAWMALTAIDQVESPQLKALLTAQRDYVRAGAHFPDSGYALSNTYGEEAHWQRYHDALMAQILTHSECTDLTAPTGPCAPLIAFLFGMAAHGMGDEVWDWLFEPNVPDLDEYYTPEDLAGYANEGGAETQMDIVAVAVYGQPTTLTKPFPDHADLLAAFDAAGLSGIQDSQLALGQVAMDVVHKAEASWAPTHIDDLHEAMPWMSHNMVTAPGGVNFAATAIAGEWNSMWGRMLGDKPQTSISITYPASGQRRIPATGWVRSHSPGSSRGRGGARTRIAAVMTDARPYQSAAHPTTSNHLPEGAMSLVEKESGDPVSIDPEYPKSVPYGSDAGEHVVDIQPSVDLKPCTWYTASVTEQLVDNDDEPVVPHSWDFRTGTDADGNRCPDDPYTPDENFARAVTSDVFDRAATDEQLQDLGYRVARGLSRKSWAKEQLGSQEEREALVTQAFQQYLGRTPDPSGLAYWATKLQTIKLPDFWARLLGSDEVFRKAGSTNAGYVAALYPLVHGRAVDPSGAAYWTNRLDRGLTRTGLAKLLLISREAAQRTVKQGFDLFLHRSPDPSGLSYWTGVLGRGADARDLWLNLIMSAEYDRNAQD